MEEKIDSKSIKVLHTECTNSFGGQEIRIINEMLILQKAGFKMFLAAKKNKPLAKEARKKGLKVFELPFRGYWDIETFIRLIYLIKKYDIDIVNTHSSQNTWLGGIAAKLLGKKFIRSRHISTPIKKSKLNFINHIADYIITTGEEIKNSIIKNNKISPKKIISIPSASDINKFNPNRYDKEKSREFFNIKKDSIIVGNLSQLREMKGLEDFIEIANILLKKYNNLIFVIAGEGDKSFKEKLQNRVKELKIEDRVIFLGYVKEPELFLKALDIFLFTSKEGEGLPQSVTQALMMSLPVIATDVGSTKDIFKGDNFILVKPKNNKDILEKLDMLIASKEERNRLSSVARESVISDFSLESMRDKIVYVYEKILNRKIDYEK